MRNWWRNTSLRVRLALLAVAPVLVYALAVAFWVPQMLHERGLALLTQAAPGGPAGERFLSSSLEQLNEHLVEDRWVAIVLGCGSCVLVGLVAFFVGRAFARKLGAMADLLLQEAGSMQGRIAGQASGANEQLEAVVSAAKTVREMADLAEQAATRAAAMGSASAHTVEVGQEGRDALFSSIEGMELMREEVGSISQSVNTLAVHAQAIGDIIETVKEIAVQTNLLALNAAIEASRSGTQGTGFGVVAGEIKRLASQSRSATGRVRKRLEDIEQGTRTAVLVLERGSGRVDSVAGAVHQAGQMVSELAETLHAASMISGQIVASVENQAASMGVVNDAIAHIRQAASSNLEAVHASEVSATRLRGLAEQLRLVVVGSAANDQV